MNKSSLNNAKTKQFLLDKKSIDQKSKVCGENRAIPAAADHYLAGGAQEVCDRSQGKGGSNKDIHRPTAKNVITIARPLENGINASITHRFFRAL